MNNEARDGFAVLHPDGMLDPSFVPDPSVSGANGSVVAVQADGKVLVTQQPATGLRLWRLNADGSLDVSFASVALKKGNIATTGEALALAAVQVEADGEIIVVGNFTSVNRSGAQRGRSAPY